VHGVSECTDKCANHIKASATANHNHSLPNLVDSETNNHSETSDNHSETSDNHSETSDNDSEIYSDPEDDNHSAHNKTHNSLHYRVVR
jgi:hypothetical protein